MSEGDRTQPTSSPTLASRSISATASKPSRRGLGAPQVSPAHSGNQKLAKPPALVDCTRAWGTICSFKIVNPPLSMSDAQKSELRRANDNPWYCLATLYGEQPALGPDDKDLATKNRTAWNRWIAGILSDVQRSALVTNGFSESELVPFTPLEKSVFCSTFASRMGRETELPPDPAAGADFRHTHFDKRLIFGGFLFARDAGFTWATFSGSVDFRSAMFSGLANFISATFSGSAEFSSATFSGFANFRSAAFSDWADFRSVKFPRFPNFDSATFSGRADFNSATFSDLAHFRLAKFPGFANFNSATFSGLANFNAATFSGSADFRSATFSGSDFRSVTFSGLADFRSATFSGLADFVNAEFTATTVFAHVHFRTSVPDFRGAMTHEATEWHGANWPPAPLDKDAAQAQVYAYERLKQEMERLKKHEDEQSFFRKELRARRGLYPLGSGPWLLNYLYEWSSDYGQSVGQPFFWFVVLFAIGFFVFANNTAFKGAPMTIGLAAGLSFANIFSFLPIKREIMTPEMVTGLSNVAQVVGVIQSLFGVILLFLLGLALRSRFRMR